MAAAITANPQPAGLARWTPSLPTNLINMINPFGTPNPADDALSSNAIPTKSPSHADPSDKKRPNLSNVPLKKSSSSSQSPSRRSSSVMFAEPETRSSDGGSRDGSVDGRRAKKTSRPKTQFSLCHPPPESKTRQKLHRRPRSLLQLHRLSASARPLPALEVIPSANFSVRLTRAITRVFKAKHGLCPNDLVVLRAEKYNAEEENEDQEAQDVIGIICRGRINGEDKIAGKVRIHTAAGVEWEAYPAVNGGYEFFSTDEHGLGMTVRWVPKRNKDGAKSTTKDGKRRFNFSTISPNSRRHPVIASLSSTGLDINDLYKMPEPTAATPLSSPKFNSNNEDDDCDDESCDQEQCQTDETLRELISLTAIFVAFKEGWSPTFKYEDKEGGSPSKSGSTPVNTPPGSPIPFPIEKRNSIKSIGSGLMRRTSVLSKSNRSSTASVPEVEEPTESTSRSASPSKAGRSRANSASTVLVHRAASNRRKNNSAATWRPDMLAAQEPLHETSKEDLSRNSRDISIPAKAPSPLAHTDGAVGEDEHKPIARPVLPEALTSGNAVPTSRSQTTVDRIDVRKAHRESMTNSDTSTGSLPAAKNNASQRGRKTKPWRKLLCGTGSASR